MAYVALLAALGGLASAALPSPGLFLAIGLGMVAIGVGWVAYRRSSDPGSLRLAGAAAVAIGAIGAVFGVLRVALALAAIDHLDRMLG
jgi:heme A synthase